MRTRHQQSFVYIGPSVPPIGLKKYTLYVTEEEPLGLRPYSAAHPVLHSLYVPTSRLAEAAAKLAVRGTAEFLADERMREISKIVLR